MIDYVSEQDVDDTKRSLYASHVASPTYTFCQGIVQEVLSNEVTTDRAKALHGAIGTALEVSYGETARVHAAELAPHFVLSGEKVAALRWSLLAGENAMRVQAHREVISHFCMALALMDEASRLEGEDSHPEGKNYRPEGEILSFCAKRRISSVSPLFYWRKLVQAGGARTSIRLFPTFISANTT